MGDVVNSSIVLGMPLVFAALGGLLAERTGVLNIGLEGLMLTGAFAAAWVAGGGGSPFLGFLFAIGVGATGGLLLGWVTVALRADQVVSGIAFNLFAVGVTGYCFALVTKGGGDLSVLTTSSGGDYAIPGLHSIPWLGPIFDQHWIAYLGYVLVPVVAIVLFRTGLGVRMRASGEYSEGAQAAGVDVLRMRICVMVVSGILSGIAGAYLVLGDVREFTTNMTAGRGYIALAVIILGRWKPFGALCAALLFGAAQAIDFKVQAQGVGIPLQLVDATPYIATLLAVAILGKKVRPPAEEGRPLMLSR